MFGFIGRSTFTGIAAELHYLQQNVAGTVNDKTLVEAGVNGDGRADFRIELAGIVTRSSAGATGSVIWVRFRARAMPCWRAVG